MANLNDILDDIVTKINNKTFVPLNGCGLIYKRTLRTHEAVKVETIYEKLEERCKFNREDLIINVIDFHIPLQSCKWVLFNACLCCVPLVVYHVRDKLLGSILGSYYEIEVWRRFKPPSLYLNATYVAFNKLPRAQLDSIPKMHHEVPKKIYYTTT